MALGFTSHYRQGEQQQFGSLTQASYNNDVESAGTSANLPSLIIGHDSALVMANLSYDSCEFSSSVVIDYTQYANAPSGGAVETAGSIASIGGDSVSTSMSSVLSFSSGGASFSGGGGMSCASFTC